MTLSRWMTIRRITESLSRCCRFRGRHQTREGICRTEASGNSLRGPPLQKLPRVTACQVYLGTDSEGMLSCASALGLPCTAFLRSLAHQLELRRVLVQWRERWPLRRYSDERGTWDGALRITAYL